MTGPPQRKEKGEVSGAISLMEENEKQPVENVGRKRN